ncbi:MAG: helix-turn-helix domain-containing protein [Sandaracinobacter sp.]
MHREDIKAELRKRYGSLIAFERAKGLPTASVKDVLRGRSVARTRRAVAEELGKPVEQVFAIKKRCHESSKVDGITLSGDVHPSNSKAA